MRAGALCGEREALNELVARTSRAGATLAARGRDGELAQARERIAQLESSTSWRMTAPLRRAMTHARVAREFSRAAVVEAYLALYRRLLGE